MAEVENKSHETWIPRVEAEGLPQRFASRIVELILLLRYICVVRTEELFGFSVKFDLVEKAAARKEALRALRAAQVLFESKEEGDGDAAVEEDKRSSSQDKELQDGKVAPPGGSLLSYIHSAPPLKLGIAIVNDFKSVEGDRAMGLQSLPVAFGTEAAKWICVSVIDATQLSVAGM
ncbi:hypothetical protein YC2023_119088 [Brassica napus]